MAMEGRVHGDRSIAAEANAAQAKGGGDIGGGDKGGRDKGGRYNDGQEIGAAEPAIATTETRLRHGQEIET
ncbi:MAG: hypothetical protein ACK5N0_03140 [Synechococcaceae cyanobacterium]